MFSRTAVMVLLSCLTASRADAQIFQPGTQPVDADGGIVVPVQSSRSCRNCHGAYDVSGDHGPYDSWRGSLMASAGRDPIVRAALAIAEEDAPGASDFCLRCHTPSAWLRGRSSLPDYAATNADHPQRLRPDAPAARGGLSNDLDGVGCMVCHRMVEPSDPAMIQNAQLVLADVLEGAVRRGPYAYGPGEDPRHEAAQEPFLSDSALCGACHDITNPLEPGHRGGVATGRRFVIERTYSEWLHSAFGDRDQTCQDCHLPEVAERAAMDGIVRPEMSRHDLAGGNVWVPLALAESLRSLDPEASSALEASSARAERMLASAATLEVLSSALEGADATLTVRVTNRSGHKLPTGYPEGRRMWLEVRVLDATGRVVAGSGLFDEATGTLTRDPQLRAYEVRIGEGLAEGFHFVRNDSLLEDTRIPPEGFRAPEELDMAPLGRDYGDGAGGYRHWDETTFRFGGLCGEGPLTVRVWLRHQSTTREYAEFLRDQAPPSDDPELAGETWGTRAYDAWQRFGGTAAVELAQVEVALGASPGACPEPVDAGVDGGPDADGGAPDAALDGGPIDAATGADAGHAAVSPGGCGCRAGGRTAGVLPWGWVPLALLAMRQRSRLRRVRAQPAAPFMRPTKRSNR